MPRYRSGSPIDAANHFAWLAPLGSASKNQLRIRILDAFSTDGAREACFGKSPHPAEAWPPNGFPMGGEGGVGGRNRPKLESWRVFGRRHLFKSSRIQDGHAHREYSYPAPSRAQVATTTLRRTARGVLVATG